METKTALQTLADGAIDSCFRILLNYYDKHYNKALNSREQLNSLLTKLDCATVNAELNADKIAGINFEILKMGNWEISAD